MMTLKLKNTEEILQKTGKQTIVIICNGCNELSLSESALTAMLNEIAVHGTDLTVIHADYMCNTDDFRLSLKKYNTKLKNTDTVLLFACGAGTQTAAPLLRENQHDFHIFTICDTIRLPGHQGLTPSEYDCEYCDSCHLNDTGAICPVTACAKGLLNGQCGGAKNGMCEVDNTRECGWELIGGKACN